MIDGLVTNNIPTQNHCTKKSLWKYYLYDIIMDEIIQRNS